MATDPSRYSHHGHSHPGDVPHVHGSEAVLELVHAYHQRNAEARLARRRESAVGLSDQDISDSLDRLAREIRALNDASVALTDEHLARLVSSNVPGAFDVVLVEDTSHDAPHGHVHSVRDTAGRTLLDGRSDEWHDLPWTGDVDEDVFDLFHLAREDFVEMPGIGRARVIPVHP